MVAVSGVGVYGWLHTSAGHTMTVIFTALANDRALQAGATVVDVCLSEDVKLVPLSADRDMFIEALVYANKCVSTALMMKPNLRSSTSIRKSMSR